MQSLILRLMRPIMMTPEKGAAASVYCATEPGLENRSGACFQRRFAGLCGAVQEFQPSQHALDEDVAAELWTLSENLVTRKLQA